MIFLILLPAVGAIVAISRARAETKAKQEIVAEHVRSGCLKRASKAKAVDHRARLEKLYRGF